jgi:hypothetical protein
MFKELKEGPVHYTTPGEAETTQGKQGAVTLSAFVKDYRCSSTLFALGVCGEEEQHFNISASASPRLRISSIPPLPLLPSLTFPTGKTSRH